MECFLKYPLHNEVDYFISSPEFINEWMTVKSDTLILISYQHKTIFFFHVTAFRLINSKTILNSFNVELIPLQGSKSGADIPEPQ